MEILIENASKTIRGAEVLKDVNLRLTGGTIYGLRGPNGSGKTMLLRLMAGLIRPNTGRVLLDGKELGKELDFPPSLGMLLENPAFLPEYTGLRNLILLAQIQNRVGASEARQALLDVGLDPEDRRTYRKYSLGMKQRLGIAAAILERPEILLLDEPTNALDAAGSALIEDRIRRERDRGALVVVASHDGAFLERLAEETYTVTEGRVAK